MNIYIFCDTMPCKLENVYYENGGSASMRVVDIELQGVISQKTVIFIFNIVFVSEINVHKCKLSNHAIIYITHYTFMVNYFDVSVTSSVRFGPPVYLDVMFLTLSILFLFNYA
jgi:hypothetical protein